MERSVEIMQDMEQQILKCWEIGEDLMQMAREHEDSDEIANQALGLKHVYEMRFNRLWYLYEQFVDAYYAERKLNEGKVNFDEGQNNVE